MLLFFGLDCASFACLLEELVIQEHVCVYVISHCVVFHGGGVGGGRGGPSGGDRIGLWPIHFTLVWGVMDGCIRKKLFTRSDQDVVFD